MQYQEELNQLRQYYDSGITRPFAFRKKRLQELQASILRYEQEIMEALYRDLKKSPEEAYASELGLVFSELRYFLKHLEAWMRPVRVATNLMNLPASSKIYRDPLGLVLIISPWNYPFQLMLNPLIGAIAGGNCMVLKPSENSPATAAVIAKILREIFPQNYVYVVEGEGGSTVPPLMEATRFDHIFYTGSVAVGKAIYRQAASQLIPVTLELGGKSPCIVEGGANLKVAARRIVFGKFLNAGQTCIAPDYVLAQETVREELILQMKKTLIRFYGRDASASYDYGKIINEERFEKILGYLQQGTIAFGGEYDRSRLYIAPTILENVSLDSPVMQEEIFGPVLPVLGYRSREEARAMIRQHENPLAFYLFTSSKQSEAEWISQVPFGGGCVNHTDLHFTNALLPFGGVGNSGIGAYHGKFSFDTFTRLKPVLKSSTRIDPDARYPPFKGRLRLIRWLMK